MKKPVRILLAVLALFIALSSCSVISVEFQTESTYTLDTIPEYSGSPYVVLNDNQPGFTDEDWTTTSYEYYSELDALGRCGVTMACIGRDLMPTESRESISSVKPTGWINKPYDFVDGQYVYNRCHLIGFQLTGENANARNLITGTRYLNVEGMLPFENMVADYVKETGSHVLYRVIPVFDGDNLVASGVQMEAWSVEDEGDGICFNVYCFNVQPGVEIDYATGENWASETVYSGEEMTYILNTSSTKFHTQDCSGAAKISDANRSEVTCTRQELLDKGYSPAGCCNP